jgi:AraC-like DNA-binding protein
MLSYGIYEPGVEGTDQLADLAMAVAFIQMRSLCGSAWVPSEVLLPHRRPAEVAPFNRFFGVPIRYDAEQAALVFPASWLEHAVPGADPGLHDLLREQLEQVSPPLSDDLPDQTRRMVRTLLTNDQCSVEHAAHLFSIHRRTLNRRLKAAGTGFHVLVDEVRYEMARQLLADTAMPIIQVAAALDYSEPSAFTRAFRRWSGQTPTTWRAAHLRSRCTRDSAVSRTVKSASPTVKQKGF